LGCNEGKDGDVTLFFGLSGKQTSAVSCMLHVLNNLHSGCKEGKDGGVTLFFGLSGAHMALHCL